MKNFARLFAATLTMMTSLALALALILSASILALNYFGFFQMIAAMVLTVSLVVTGLIHWSEQKSFPFR